jgi:hypothetical protein
MMHSCNEQRVSIPHRTEGKKRELCNSSRFFVYGFRKEWSIRNPCFSQLQRFRNNTNQGYRNEFYRVIVTAYTG